jgi:hypothetical protein
MSLKVDIDGVLLIDLATFGFAVLTLLLIRLPGGYMGKVLLVLAKLLNGFTIGSNGQGEGR